MALPTIITNISANDAYYSEEEITIELESSNFSGASAPYTPTESNLQAYVELWDKTNPPDKKILALHAPYNYDTKSTTFNLGSLALPTPELPTIASIIGAPLITGSSPLAVNKLYYKYTDKFGDPPVPDTLTTSPDFYVLAGQRAGDNDPDQVLPSAIPFILLHSEQGKKIVALDQPDYLYLYTNTGVTLDVSVTLHMEDGSDNTIAVDSVVMLSKKVYWLQAGLKQLNIDTAGLYAYTIILTEQGGIGYSTSKLYEIDRTCQDWGITLIYNTGLGSFESIFLKGKGTYGYQVATDTYKTDTGAIKNANAIGNTTIKASTGYYTRENLTHLAQLLHAEVYLVEETGFTSYIITSRRITQATDDADLFAMELSLRPAWDNHNYTRLTLPA